MDMESHDRTAKIAADQAQAADEKNDEPKKPLGFVAVAAGSGEEEILRSLGVDVVVSGGQTMNPSTADILAAIEQVNVAVRQMDEMTQHNAALVEEINASIEQTERQATELDRVVDVFTLTDTPQRTEPAQPPAPGIKGLQQKVRAAAKTYLSHGNAAIKDDWSEF